MMSAVTRVGARWRPQANRGFATLWAATAVSTVGDGARLAALGARSLIRSVVAW